MGRTGFVGDCEASKNFYTEVLGGTAIMDGGPTVVKLANSWIVINEGSGLTEDKPEVILDVPADSNQWSAFMNIRLADIQDAYEMWSAKGATFLTPPIDRGAEIRCYMRDRDDHPIEVGQATGVLT